MEVSKSARVTTAGAEDVFCSQFGTHVPRGPGTRTVCGLQQIAVKIAVHFPVLSPRKRRGESAVRICKRD
jgi:hypothetical protein